MHKKSALTLGVLFLAAGSAVADPIRPTTYICIEERSVGWDFPKDGQEAVGSFRPSTSPVIVKYYATGALRSLEPEFVEIVSNGQTQTFPSDRCSTVERQIVTDKRAGFEQPFAQYVDDCKRLPQHNFIFGTPVSGIFFTNDLANAPKTTRFRKHLLAGIIAAYVNLGTCTLADGP